MTKILVVGDLHFKSSNLVEGEELVHQLLTKIYEIGNMDGIVFLGDLLDNHATVHSQALNLVDKLLKSLGNYNVFVLIGNHDYINNSQFMSTEHPFNVLKNWGDKLRIVDTLVEWKRGNEWFVFLPYIPTGRFNEAISLKYQSSEDLKKVNCIFCHQEFKGSILDEQGDHWPYETFIVSGHIHEKCKLSDQNVFYPGSPVQHCFAEKPGKAIHLYDSESGIFTPYQLSIPQKYAIEHDLKDIDSLVLPQGNVRLRLKCTSSAWIVFKKTQKYKELIEAKIKIQPLPVDDEVQLKRMASKRTTYIDALKTYAENSGGFVQEAFNEIMSGMGA